eukprot:Awhi_evm1s7939
MMQSPIVLKPYNNTALQKRDLLAFTLVLERKQISTVAHLLICTIAIVKLTKPSKKLNDKHFQSAQETWGPHTVDLFAAQHNAQLYRSGTLNEDAFSMDWRNESGRANPSFLLIGKVLHYNKETKSTITLFLPYWQEPNWFEKWQDILIDIPIVLPKDNDTFPKE